MLSSTISNALANLTILVVIPLAVYFLFHKLRHKRGVGEVAKRAGLRIGEPRYIGYCTLLAAAMVAVILIWPPALDPMTREGSSWTNFVGLGFGGTSVIMALLYGVVQTGFAEEFFFRGLVAGSLSRRLPLLWANLAQALIFLAPHLLLLRFAPEMWPILVVIFAGSLFVGWARIKSDSILGPWLVHAALNVTMGLTVALRTAA
jgi:membrane protease YdiL (CAAX protease family)